MHTLNCEQYMTPPQKYHTLFTFNCKIYASAILVLLMGKSVYRRIGMKGQQLEGYGGTESYLQMCTTGFLLKCISISKQSPTTQHLYPNWPSISYGMTLFYHQVFCILQKKLSCFRCYFKNQITIWYKMTVLKVYCKRSSVFSIMVFLRNRLDPIF